MQLQIPVRAHYYSRVNGRGFNLIEAAIVLGVVGLVIGGIWVAASAVQENLRTKRMQEGITSIYQGILSQYKGFDAGGGGTTLARSDLASDPIIRFDYAPKDFVRGNKLIDPWGLPIDVTLDASNNAVNFWIRGNSKSTCAKLVTFFLVQGWDNITPNTWQKVIHTHDWSAEILNYSTGWGRPTFPVASSGCTNDTWSFLFSYKR
jgi:hypothetical protein